ncbi:siphovirus Gp157 family protein [Lentilactobacillus sp. Marseille-Q4993]|uniref:siphovirus Gp157 family protein n=1 Tax=Lentilactobacillus sp. Marseille-Q4993 TaxID=3039492 RepID=UPI0024BC4F0D|nr:siphovirus Gp157 family protein [Lentilactobacillus sp. Marseille-Q4993]
MATLYELTDQYQALLNAIDSDDPQLVADTIASTGLQDDIEHKFQGYGQVINQTKADIEELKTEIKRLQGKKKTLDNNLACLKDSLLQSLNAIGQTKVKTPMFSFSIKETTAVELVDESQLADEFLIPQPAKVDKTAIKKAIQAGEEVTGARLQNNESLTMR